MATQTQTPVAADFDAVVVCDYCLKPAVARNMTRLTVHGVTLDICHVDTAYIGRRPVHTRARMILRLARLYGAAQAEGDGEDGDDGGPAPASPAAPSARPVRPFSVATWTGAPVYLTAEELAELDEFEAAVAVAVDPVPCDACGKAASPAVETDAGTYCLACAEGPSAPPSARAAVRDVRITQTARRLACARLGRNLAGARR